MEHSTSDPLHTDHQPYVICFLKFLCKTKLLFSHKLVL